MRSHGFPDPAQRDPAHDHSLLTLRSHPVTLFSRGQATVVPLT